MAVKFTFTAPASQYPLITSASELDGQEAAGRMAGSGLGTIVDCPIIAVEAPANSP